MRFHAKLTIVKLLLLVTGAVMLLLGGSVSLKAQVDSGDVNGTVMDTTGAIIPGAKVSLTEVNTGQTFVTNTGKDGQYTFSPVKIGSYTVSVVQPGFRQSVSHITVAIQQQVRANFKLVPGEVTQKVEVTSAAQLLQTEDASVGTVATQAQIQDLPLNGRNYTFLAQLDAGVTSLNPTRGLDATGSFVANGLTTVHNNYIIDGIDNNNDTVDFLNGTAYVDLPPPDAIREFKLQTSNFSAEFGRAGGAVVNASIKSGTNQFHGSAWEFVRNDDLDAIPLSQYFSSTKTHTPYKWNQFGASAGFPIFKNKLFAFGDYEGYHIRQAELLGATVPTPAEVTSGYTNFTDQFMNNSTGTVSDDLGRTFNVETIFDPAKTRTVTKGVLDPVTNLVATATGYVRDPFYTGGSIVGITNWIPLEAQLNQLPANRLDSNAIKLLQLMPGANQSGAAHEFSNNYEVNASEPDNRNHFDIRVDYNLTSKDQMFGRVSYGKRSEYVPSVINGLGANPGFGSGNFIDDSTNYEYSETHTFSPTLINEARFGYSHLYTVAQPTVSSQQGIAAQFGIQGIPGGPNNGGLPNINVTGLVSLGPGGYASPNNRTSNTIQVTENVTKLWGAQNLRMGVEYQHLSFPWEAPPYPRGYFQFGNGGGYYTTVPGTNQGVGAADFLLSPIAATVPNGINDVGGSDYVQATSISLSDDLRNYFGAYFQDDWIITPKLTVNLGLRWEIFGALKEANNEQAGLVPNSSFTSGQYDILAAQKSVTLAPSFLTLLTKDNISLNYVNSSSIISAQKANFAPRVGLAYQVLPRLVVRGSYGIFYGGFENIGGAPDPSQNYPFFVYLQTSGDSEHPLVYPDGKIATLEDGLTDFEPSPTNPTFNPEGLSPIAYNQNPKTPYTHEWNAAVEYELSPNQTITATYIGNNSIHMLNGAYMNQPTEILPPTVNPQSYIAFPDLGRNLNYMTDNGAAYYEGFQFSYEHRTSHGLQFMANYSRSVCKTDNRNILNIGEGSSARAYQLAGWPGIRADYQYCGDDVPDIFHASGIYDLPFGKGRMMAANLSRAADAVIGGWSVQGIYTLQDGFPGTIGCTASTTSDYGCHANVVSGQSVYAHTTNQYGRQFLNPNSFTEPPVVTTIGQTDFSPLGGVGQQFHGPDYDDIDLSLFKRFYFTERIHVEFRAEAFNAINHPNFSNGFLTGNFSNTAEFGVLNSTRGNGRQLQLALKLLW